MEIVEETMLMDDGKEVFVRRWIPKNMETVVQLCHGMTEHSGSYMEFGQALTEHNIGLVCHDHRGHGLTAKSKNELGCFPENGGWERVVDDVRFIGRNIRKKWNGNFFIMGHSMGSFIARRVVQLEGNLYDGLVISGTACHPGNLGKLGKQVAKLQSNIRGKHAKGKLVHKLSFGGFNRNFSDGNTEYQWLSSDREQVEVYVKDELCGFVCSNYFYHELFKGLMEVNNPQEMRRTPKEMPIYLFAGDQDPVGNRGKGVERVFREYQDAGIADVQCKLYPGGRHEMLHEVNREEVARDVIRWLKSKYKISSK